MENKVPVKIFLIAGEASGDFLGARLMQALRQEAGDSVEFYGVGGAGMEQQGLQSIFPMQELSVMGLWEIIPHIPRILRRIGQTVAEIRRIRPDAVVTIDSPGFNKRVAKKIRGDGIPMIHYVAPSVWAWRPGRAKVMASLFDHLLCLLPFEPPYFTREGLGATFVGHPIAEQILPKPQDKTPGTKALCLLPGSRRKEIETMLPVFLESYRLLRYKNPGLGARLVTLPHLKGLVHGYTKISGLPVDVSDDMDKKFDIFQNCDVALAASGTVSLELAHAGVPCVIAYKVSKVTEFILKRLLKIRSVTLTNIVLGKDSVAEFLQDAATPQNLANAIEDLLVSETKRDVKIAEGKKAVALLRAVKPPSQMAAELVLSLAKRAKSADDNGEHGQAGDGNRNALGR